MSVAKLAPAEREAVAAFSGDAALAAALFAAIGSRPREGFLSASTLVSEANLGVTEERASQAVLRRAVALGLLQESGDGFRARQGTLETIARLSLMLGAVHQYKSVVHVDATSAQVVLTVPSGAGRLEQQLTDLGWRKSAFELTQTAFLGLAEAATKRLVVMTPFLDEAGADWLKTLFSAGRRGVELVVVLRSLEDPKRADYPTGYRKIEEWLRDKQAKVINYSAPRIGAPGRETFHAKVVLCDRSLAYLGSSNLTAASKEHSVELGVVLKGTAAAEVAEVVDAVLKAAKQVC